MAKYTSDKLYFDGKNRYKPGVPFDLREGQKPGRGMVKVEEAKPKEAEPKADKQNGRGRRNAPETLSEVTKADTEAMGEELNG